MISLNRKEIIDLLPHREPMLLIDELKDIKKLESATAIMNVKKDGFYVQGHFPGQPVIPGVLIVEAFGQAAEQINDAGKLLKVIESRTIQHQLLVMIFWLVAMTGLLYNMI